MTVYTDYIGSGAGAGYATFAEWYAASGDGDVSYSDGDEVQVIFQSSGDGHYVPHSFGGDQAGGWLPDSELTITLSSTKDPDVEFHMGASSTYLTLDSDLRLKPLNKVKTYNFKNLDIHCPSNKISLGDEGYDAGSPETSSTLVNFENCKIVTNTRWIDVGRDSVNASGPYTITYNNCAVVADSNRHIRNAGTSYVKWKLINSTFVCVINGIIALEPDRSNNLGNEVHTSGTIIRLASRFSRFADGRSGNQFVSGIAIDTITNESPLRWIGADAGTGNWASAGNFLNLALTGTDNGTNGDIVFGITPTAGQVAFSGALPDAADTIPWTDLRLVSSTNNVASGFVSYYTPPSPDLAGHDRGSTPFDAGPFEISFTTGGGGSIDTRPTFKIVRVNMYN